MHDIAADRVEYHGKTLEGVNASTEPLALFRGWLEDAYAAGNPEPTAMQLATVALDEGGVPHPSIRTVLLKEVDERGFVFFTNYRSRKSREIEGVPQVALHWYWPALARAVRVEGVARKVSREESEAYFVTRPRGSRLGAWASRQSEPIGSRAELLARYAQVGEEFSGREVPCPDTWGGWRVVPEAIEFWQGEPSRLHDRVRFVRDVLGSGGPAGAGSAWRLERLAP